MDYGTECGNGFWPCGYSAYERAFMGWLTPVELTSDTVITGMPALSGSPTAYMVRNDGHPDEYYLIENRQSKGWDTKLPGSGIVIFHVDYDEEIFYLSEVNTPKLQRYLIIPANDEILPIPVWKINSGWAYPYNGNNSLTNTSAPAATLNNANKDGKFLMSKSITDMSVNNGLASFKFERDYTGINSVRANAADDAWYTIDGRRLSDKPVVHGLYIHRGELVLIR